MSVSAAKLSVFVEERFAFVKIAGRANFTSSVEFKTLLDELRQRGYEHFVLDLSQCVLMDSTFLGVLAGFGLKLCGVQKQPGCSGLELLNPNSRISELLDTLGIIHLFNIKNGSVLTPSGAPTDLPASPAASQEQITRACLEAHEALMKINPDNVCRFKDVAQFLAEDLKKLGGAGPVTGK
jgi:anti-anti-sigma factor